MQNSNGTLKWACFQSSLANPDGNGDFNTRTRHPMIDTVCDPPCTTTACIVGTEPGQSTCCAREAVIQGFIQDFSERGGRGGGGGGGKPSDAPTYQETVPITNVLIARTHPLGVFEQTHTFFCNSCHFAAVLCFKTNNCANLKGGGGGV